jgi:hypothetical protein
LARNMMTEILEAVDKTIYESIARKRSWVVEHKGDEKKLTTIYGDIYYKRTLYVPKGGGKSVYLLDVLLGMESHEKTSMAAIAAMIEEAVETSYRKGGENACLTDDIISKQTVKKEIHTLEVEMPQEPPKEKKRIKNLHIQADEAHVAAQFWNKKGDLKTSINGYKVNTIMPKLITIYDDIVLDGGPKSKRHKLVGKHHFGGVYEGDKNEELWLKVAQYIDDNYDTEYLERVYIAGDGASWIKEGLQIIEKSKFVLDKFHLGKYIHGATVHLLDSAEDVKESIYEAINNQDKGEVKRIFHQIIEITENENKQEEVKAALRYITNHWNGIMVRIEDGGAVWGCSAEGQVSHVYAARESSLPMGWSKLGAHKISQLRVFTRNGGKIVDLLRYQKKKQQKEKRIEQQEELVKEMKKRYQNSSEEILNAKIPGIEQRQMNWMRDIIHSGFYKGA